MAERTRLLRDDAYHEMGASYQCVQLAILEAALQENGISDSTLRQKICETFLFMLGDFHDQGWLKPSVGADPVYPLLCFSRRFLNTDTPVDGLGDVFAPSESFSFHELAFGTSSLWYEGDPASQVETGSFRLGDDEDS